MRIGHLAPEAAAVAIAVALAGGAVLTSGPGADGLRNLVFDGYQRVLPRPYDPEAPVRVALIDDESLQRLGQWPWSRDRLAAAVSRLRELGAAVVALDVILAEPDRTSPDQIAAALPAGPDRDRISAVLAGRSHDGTLAAAISATPSVLGVVLANDSAALPPPPRSGTVELGDPAAPFLQTFSGAVPPLPALATAAQGLGAVNWRPDRDLVVRRVPLVFGTPVGIYPSLATETLRLALDARSVTLRSSNANGSTAFGRASGVNAVRIGELTIPTDPDGSIRVRYAGWRDARHISFWRLLEPDGVKREEVEGRIVLIGTGASALGDVRATPLDDSVPGVDVHAELIEQVLMGQSISRPDYARGLELAVLVLGALLAAAAVRMLRPGPAAAAAAIVLAAVAAGSWYGFTRLGILLDPVVPGGGILAAFTSTMIIVHRRSERERRRIRDAFSHYVAPEIVEAIAADPAALRLGGQTRPLTILFCDLRGFTSRSESMSAESVIRFLNGMHTPLTEAVLAERGTIDKYIGDGLMAFWNAPLDVPDHAARCCAAALRMIACLPIIERALAAEIGHQALREEPIGLGIGIHTGMACVGNMGSALRFDYSIVGDAVNTASRIEPLTKRYGVPVIVSEEVVRASAGRFVFLPLDEIRLKGHARATRLYALAGERGGATVQLAEFARRHEAVWAAVLSGEREAATALQELRRHPQAADYRHTYDIWLAERIEAGASAPVTAPILD